MTLACYGALKIVGVIIIIIIIIINYVSVAPKVKKVVCVSVCRFYLSVCFFRRKVRLWILPSA